MHADRRSRGSTRLAVLLLMGAASAGCSHTRGLRPGGPAEDYDGVNRSLRGRTTEVVSREGGTIFRLENVRVTPDSAVGLVGGTWQGRRLADIAQITVKSRARGAWDGLKIGAGAGVLLGAVLYDERTCRDALGILCDRTSYTILNGIGGAIWGLIIGPMIGSRIRYVVGGR